MESSSRSICPKCLNVVDSTVFEIDEKIFIKQKCPEHGTFVSPHLFHNRDIYLSMKSLIELETKDGDLVPDTAFLDITDACNMKCPDCFKTYEHTIICPTPEDIISQTKKYTGSIIYLFGGEPTLREDLLEIIDDLKSRGYSPSFFTNGIKLCNPVYASTFSKTKPLIVLSIDTLDKKQGKQLYGESVVKEKLEALNRLIRLDIPVFLNIVLKNGLNENQVNEFINLLRISKGRIRGLSFSTYWDPKGKNVIYSVPAHKTIGLINQCMGTRLEDFIECTKFGISFSQLMRKISGKGGRRVSACYLRLYLIRCGQSIQPINKFIDLTVLNDRLLRINEKMTLKKRTDKILALIKIILAFIFSVKDMQLWILMLPSVGKVKRIITENAHPATILLPSVNSIIVNRYFDASNVDLKFVSCCSLGGFEGDYVVPFCLREIYRINDETYLKHSRGVV